MSYSEGLKLLAINPRLVGELCNLIGSMPNIDFPTMGGAICWDTLAEYDGWRLQQNKFTDHCRLIDPGNVRKAWGSKNAMTSALGKLSKQSLMEESKSKPSSSTGYVFCPNCGERVPDGNYCKSCGSKM